jgi:hypothetical protein
MYHKTFINCKPVIIGVMVNIAVFFANLIQKFEFKGTKKCPHMPTFLSFLYCLLNLPLQNYAKISCAHLRFFFFFYFSLEMVMKREKGKSYIRPYTFL